MRDIDRIDIFCNELAAIWKEKCPDWRFGQLIVNFLGWYGRGPFYMEENDFIEELREFLKKV